MNSLLIALATMLTLSAHGQSPEQPSDQSQGSGAVTGLPPDMKIQGAGTVGNVDQAAGHGTVGAPEQPEHAPAKDKERGAGKGL